MTSQRLFNFAMALSDGDESKMKKMQEAVTAGYREAEKSWGGALPEICGKTLEATNKLFDDYYASLKKEDSEAK